MNDFLDIWAAATSLVSGAALALIVYGIVVLGRRRTMRARLAAVAGDLVVEQQDAAETRVSGPQLVVAGIGQLLARVLPSPLVNRLRLSSRQAGLSGRGTADVLLGVRALAIVVGAVVGYALATSGQGMLGTVGAALVVGLACCGLDLYLSTRAHARRSAADRELPTVMDLLTLTLAAGLGFDNALEMILVHFEGPLTDELTRYLLEIRKLGARRTIALREVAQRLGDPPDLVDFADALNRAQQMGTGLLAAVESQVVLLRQERHRRIASAAQRAPVRMLIPMTMFMLPVLMLIVLAPVGLRVATATGGLH